MLEDEQSCDCGGCECAGDKTTTVPALTVEDPTPQQESCPATCNGQTCDQKWALHDKTCELLEDNGCDCSGCKCLGDATTLPACPATCGGQTCDQKWALSDKTCELLEKNGCDCAGCECVGDAARGNDEAEASANSPGASDTKEDDNGMMTIVIIILVGAVVLGLIGATVFVVLKVVKKKSEHELSSGKRVTTIATAHDITGDRCEKDMGEGNGSFA